MQNTLYIVFSSLPMFICAFWSVVLILHTNKQSHPSKKILKNFMLTATSLYFGHFVVFNHLHSLIPVTDTIYSFATLSVYPIYYLYIVSLTDKIKPKQYLILLPGTLIAGVIGLCYLLMQDEILEQFIQSCLYENIKHPAHLISNISIQAHELMKPIILIQVVLVLIFGFRKLKRFKQKVEEYFSNTEKKDLKDIRHLLIAFIITSFMSATADLIGRAFFVDSLILMLSVLIPFSIMLFLLGFVGYVQKFTIDDLINEIKEDEVPTLQPEINNRSILKKQIDQLMEKDKLFLHSDLKISDIAIRLNTNRTYVYEALKSAEDKKDLSFNDYVNRYRIKYSQRLLLEDKENMNIDNIIIESGFSSRTTFYKNFKKFTGITPKQFMKDSHQKSIVSSVS